MSSCPQSHMILWSCCLIRSCDKLKPLYLHYCGAYGHQFWQDGNLLWWSSTSKVIWPFDLAISLDKLKPLYLHYRSAYGQQTWQDGNLPWWALASNVAWLFLITWSCEIIWQFKIIISPLPQCLWPPNLANCKLTMRGFHS